eukprot:273040_1
MLKNEDGTFRKWVIDNVYDEGSTDQTLCKMLDIFAQALDQNKAKGGFGHFLAKNKGQLANVHHAKRALSALPDALRKEETLLKHIKAYYKEEQLAAIEKAWLQSEPIAVQIAMLKHEYEQQRDNTEASKIREEDLWLWKWKKMPKMDEKKED